MPEPAVSAHWQRRLLLMLLLAPALLWLVGLIILPHVDLAVLSLRGALPRASTRRASAIPRISRATALACLRAHGAAVRTGHAAHAHRGLPGRLVIAKVARGRVSALLFVVASSPSG
jgi:spermidine/putrescine transport system permease protein